MHKAKKVGILAAVLLVIAAIIGGIYYMQSWPLRFHSTFDRFLGDGNWELISAETKTSLMYEVYYRKQPLLGQEFEPLSQQVTELLSLKERGSDMHAISNLALLNMSDNAALSNATFDVKRNAIVEMDKAGQYIPFCTKMVFLKYYTPSAQNQLHFWGQPDRVAYIENINRILEPYLEEKISMKEDAE